MQRHANTLKRRDKHKLLSHAQNVSRASAACHAELRRRLQPAALKAASRRSHELRLGGCVQTLGSATVSTLPDTLQRGQHAGAGLGTGPHDPSRGQHDTVRCWFQ